jgi:hypothetical protein
MSRRLALSVPSAALAGAALTLLGLAAGPRAADSPERRRPEGHPVTKYTKVWTDDYHNDNKVVYRAYSKTFKDELGDEIAVEIWHGKATGFHKNGKLRWEVDYRDGKREGEFTSWSEDGVRTGRGTFQRGRPHGKSYEWSRDGRKTSEATYEQGKLNGEARWWDTGGQLLTTGTYRDGVPWAGTFPEVNTSPRSSLSRWVIRRYEAGELVSEDPLTGNWWW